jgi:quinol monooxygenase YgiN
LIQSDSTCSCPAGALRENTPMPDPGLLLVAEIHGLAAREPELRGLLEALAAGTREEAGCVGYRVLATDDPGELVTLGSWLDEAALRAHYATPHYRRYRMEVGPLLARPSTVVVHHIGSTVHAADPNPPDPGLLG